MAKQLNLVPIPGSRTVVGNIELIADRAIGRRHQIGTVLVRQLSEHELAHEADHEGEDDDD
nr:hypothetical protein [Tessaracoccus coleopterorum]